MFTQHTYAIDFNAYGKLIAEIEDKFNKYKEKLISLNILVSHPSNIKSLSETSVQILYQTFPKEINVYKTPFDFYQTLICINYHLNSFIMLSTVVHFSNVKFVNITIEELLILKSFSDL